MRVLFLGTPEFAVPSLRTLLETSCDVVAVVTPPDRPAGRGQQLQPPAVKVAALEKGLPLLQIEKIRDPRWRPVLEGYHPDFLVVVAFGQILPGWLLELPRIATVNVHASLLPRHRGAAPVNWALLSGDEATGVTTMLMEERLDTGPILLQHRISLSGDMTAGELSEELSRAGAELLTPTLQGLAQGSIRPVPQDHSRATYAPRITKEMARIDWSKEAVAIHNQVRGLNPWPVAATEFRGRTLKVYRSRVVRGPGCGEGAPGTLAGASTEGLLVRCGGGSVLELLELQLPGKGRITGRAFGNGARLQAGDPLFSSSRE